MQMENVEKVREKLFEMACTGDLENLDTYWKITGSLDVTCRKFGAEHSLVMGAFRNRQWETVRWLLEHGAKLTDSEQEEINDQYMEMSLMQKMQNIVQDGRG